MNDTYFPTDKFCPILLIGMPPPEEPLDQDLRLCTPACNWYDELEDNCVLNLIKDRLDYQNKLVEYEHGYESVTENTELWSDPFYHSDTTPSEYEPDI